MDTLPGVLWWGVALIGVLVLAEVVRAAVRSGRSGEARDGAAPGGAPDEAGDLFALGGELEPRFQRSAFPADLIGDEQFEQAVKSLLASDLDEVLGFAVGANWILSTIALEALARREDAGPRTPQVIAKLHEMGAWPLYFAIRFLCERGSGPVIGPALARAQPWWLEAPGCHQIIEHLVSHRVEQGEQPAFGDALDRSGTEALEMVEGILRELRSPHVRALVDELRSIRERRVDHGFLRSIGRLQTQATLRAETLVEDERSLLYLRRLLDTVEREPPCSLLLVGEPGVGKTTLRRLLGLKMLARGWRVLEVTAAGFIAGKSYIGEIEGQVKRVLENATVRQRVVLSIDRFHELATAGAYKEGGGSVLDQLLPAIERNELLVIGELGPQPFAGLLRRRPTLPSMVDVVPVDPAPPDHTVELCAKIIATLCTELPAAQADGLAADALDLAGSHLTMKQRPGNAIDLIKAALMRQRGESDGATVLDRGELLATLSQLSGLPEEMLDDRSRLDIDEVRRRFEASVIGQQEAVDCLVERIAMIKAGLTDSARPYGVFLFAGPTGTGKTEIAKSLARILFGGADRLVRVDMSEFQGSDSAWRLLGGTVDERSESARSLVDRVRSQPFSVVLLDEFEKAHPNVWDVFLQVFDDGRLTDARGAVADFRHTIIMLTSNVGSTIQRSAMGFTGAAEFSERDVTEAIARTFRREFINRIDRVVVFQPLSPTNMRRILYKELRAVLERRGLRNREWAVEWEDSAVDFLLQRGFTPDLGARPLRRAIDRYVLAPLSMAIVRDQFPEGDQFLFVRSDGMDIQVEFVDPDADRSAPSPAAAPDGAAPVGSLSQVVSEARGTPDELALLEAQYAQVDGVIASPQWSAEKERSLARLGDPDFWQSADRYAVLGRVELMDRLDAAARSLRSLLNRLRHAPTRQLSQAVAQKLYLMQTAIADARERRPGDAFLAVSARPEPGGDGDAGELRGFFDKVCRMYAEWARARQMKLTVLERTEDELGAHWLCEVRGFGACTILEPEAGLHVAEMPAGEGRTIRYTVRVVVAPQPDSPQGDRAALARAGRRAVDAIREAASDVVRRYRFGSSPLVRDRVRGWRTGRLDRVLGGDFDVVT